MAKCNPNSVIQIAMNEVGYLEKASNSQLDSKTANAGKNNYTKYNRDYNAWGGGGAQPMEWCASFVSWCFVMAFGLAAAKALLCGGLHHYTPTGAGRFKKQNRYIKRGEGKPQVGDVIYFYSSAKGRIGHVGLVYKVSGNYVYTIEGNTSGASSLITNGGGVKKKSYKLTSTYIDGYGRPDYAGVESGTGEIHAPELGERILRKGDIGEDVKALQENLIKLNYDVGKYGIDGEFGSDTEDALKAYQKDHDLEVDGEYGPLSHASMMAELDKLDGDTPETEDKPETAEPEKPEIPDGGLVVAKGSWNVRTGPGTDYASVAIVHGGDRLSQVPSDGWTPILLKNEIRWISNKALEALA